MYKLFTLLNDEIGSFNISDEPSVHNLSSIHRKHYLLRNSVTDQLSYRLHRKAFMRENCDIIELCQ